ncbi:MAG: tryptophan synthase subunit alpha, partial [Microbacteriaceae bacterium]|nr:tryptophan synthase subunit alpha [Microbacteriaceae bacterium]
EQVREVLNYADGAIVGSALVAALEADGVSGLRERAMSLVDGIRLG